MELTPSFKVKVLKEWGIVYVLIGVYELLTGIASMEREWISNTNILICSNIYQYSCNNIFTKQSSSTDVTNF